MSNVHGKRVAVLVEKFYEDLELWYPVLRLREAGCTVQIVGPKAGETYGSKHGYPAKADVAASEVGPDRALVVDCGHPLATRRHPAVGDADPLRVEGDPGAAELAHHPTPVRVTAVQ